MARFRPSKLFRRFSSRSDNNPTLATDNPPPSPSSSGLPSPPLPIFTATPPRQVRKSSSLPKLRKRLHAAAAENKIAAERPEVVQEQRESVALGTEGEVQGEEWLDPLSKTVTLASERESGSFEGEEKAAEIVAEVDLEELEPLKTHPSIVLRRPTSPDVAEHVRAAAGRHASTVNSQQRDSGEVTLANPSPSEDETNAEAGESSSPRASADLPQENTQQSEKVDRPTEGTIRRPSIVDSANAKIVKTLLDAPSKREIGLPTTGSSNHETSASVDSFTAGLQNITSMMHRKIWVKRPGASATLVQIREDDLVDDARDTILKKYANSLGKTFDSPDMTLHIASRVEQGQQQPRSERLLGPEEEMCRTIDSYYPGGQTVEEALLINTPLRRTPRPSPRGYYPSNYQTMDDYRPLENGTDYFPPMPAMIPATLPQTAGSHESRGSHHHHSVAAQGGEHVRSISVLNTGQVPPLPSPGGQSRRHQHRPKYQRQPTSSPTILSHPNAGPVVLDAVPNPQPHLIHRASARPRLDSSASEAHRPNGVPAPPPLPTPPAPEAPPTNMINSNPPTPGAGPVGPHSHRLSRPKKPRKPTPDTQLNTHSRGRKKDSSSASSPHPNSTIQGLLDASVPPINVLIVEDNIINLRILEGLMKRLKVRWQTAMNGQIAVDKWKTGGYHLVLMDIQMPIMNGLQATKEIRRLEVVNGIGVFNSASPDDEEGPNGEKLDDESGEAGNDSKPARKHSSKADDTLAGLSEGLFKSPVIIVALTASSLQSDRHEALAAGCNDFLTKPVNFVWLERKVKEWGCMQALIDFDGWRRWKDYAAKADEGKTEEERKKEKEKEEKDRVKAEKMARLQEKQAKAKEERERKKRASLSAGEGMGEVKEEREGEGVGGVLKSGHQVLGEANFELS